MSKIEKLMERKRKMLKRHRKEEELLDNEIAHEREKPTLTKKQICERAALRGEQVIEMRDQKNMKWKDIANHFGVHPQTIRCVYGTYFRRKLRLERELQETP